MKKMLVLAGAFVVLGVLSGCGSGNADSIVKEQIKVLNEKAELLGDPKKNDDKIKAADAKLADLQKALEKTPQDQRDKAIKDNFMDFSAASTKVLAKQGSSAVNDFLKGAQSMLDQAAKDAKKGGADAKKTADDLKKTGDDFLKEFNKNK